MDGVANSSCPEQNIGFHAVRAGGMLWGGKEDNEVLFLTQAKPHIELKALPCCRLDSIGFSNAGKSNASFKTNCLLSDLLSFSLMRRGFTPSWAPTTCRQRSAYRATVPPKKIKNKKIILKGLAHRLPLQCLLCLTLMIIYVTHNACHYTGLKITSTTFPVLLWIFSILKHKKTRLKHKETCNFGGLLTLKTFHGT